MKEENQEDGFTYVEVAKHLVNNEEHINLFFNGNIIAYINNENQAKEIKAYINKEES